MRISADGVEEDLCNGSEPQILHQSARLTIVLKEQSKEAMKSALETMLQKFQDQSIQANQGEDNEDCSELKDTVQLPMEGAEGGSFPPSGGESPVVENACIVPSFWNKMKEELKKEITEEVMQKLNKQLAEEKGVKMEENKDTEETHDTEDVLHYGVYCDSCDQQIHGIRYKCGNCEDFDLCEKCESEDLHNKHDASHIFLKIRIPSCLFTLQEGTRKKIYQVPLRNADEAQNIHLDHSSETKADENKGCMKAKFIHDETIPDGTCVAPSMEFVKTWRVCNSGMKPWTKDTVFRVLWGNLDMKPSSDEVLAPQLNSGEEGLVSVTFTAPASCGHFESYWEFQHLGRSFGDTFWCRIRVESLQPIEIFPLVVPNRSSALKALKLQHHQCLLKNKRKVKEEKRKKRENRRKDVKQIVDVLTAVHEDRDCNPRNIGQRKHLVTSQTATPNNTPFDLSPPKSPEPEEFVEIKSEVSISSSELVAEQPLERTLTQDGDDKASIATLSSSESDNEFVVIPMPKCFSIVEPDVFNSYQTDLLHSNAPSPPSKATKQPAVASPTLLEKQGSSESVSQETGVPEEIENLNLMTTIQLKEDCHKKVIVSNVSLSCSPSSSSISVVNSGPSSPAAKSETENEMTHFVEVEQENMALHQNDVSSASDEAVEESIGSGSSSTFPKFPLNVGSDPVAAEEAECSATQPRPELCDPTSAVGVEVLPGGVVKQALLAAATVYNTARAVISNLQPGRSDEGESANSLQQNIPTMQLSPHEQLVEMGFCNRILNEQLLRENSYDVARVVAELVSLSDNDWYASRHATIPQQPPTSG